MLQKLIAIIAPANKAFVAAVLPVFTVVTADLINAVSVAANGWVTTVTVSVLTAFGVYQVPNKDQA